MFTRFSGLFLSLAPVAALAGANVLAGPVYYVTDLHADSAYSHAGLNLAALFYADFRYISDASEGGTGSQDINSLNVNSEGLPLPGLPVFIETTAAATSATAGQLAFALDPYLAIDTEEVFYTAGFTWNEAYLYRSGADGCLG